MRSPEKKLRRVAVAACIAALGAVGCDAILGIGDLNSLPADAGLDAAKIDSSVTDGNTNGDGGDANDASSIDATFDGTSPPADAAGVGLEAYVKSINTTTAALTAEFGQSVALSSDGNTLVVGAHKESSDGTSQMDTSEPGAGAAYVFTRTGTTWTETAYLKASNNRADAQFGQAVALSASGDVLAISAPNESSNATGVDGNQNDTSDPGAGAVYVFYKDPTAGTWSQTAYLKASNTVANLDFGGALSISGDGFTIAVGAYGDSANSSGVGGSQTQTGASGAGAVYVFSSSTGKGTSFTQQAFIKASDPSANANFAAVAISNDGNALAVGAFGEGTAGTGVNPAQTGSSAFSGAVYIFARDGTGHWTQTDFLKASNAQGSGYFGYALSISANGNALAVGSNGEASPATGVNGDQNGTGAFQSGAVYTFKRTAGVWTQDAYVKASNTSVAVEALFGAAVAISGDGNSLLVGAYAEASNALGVNASIETDASAPSSGAAYFFTRTATTTWTQRDYIKAPAARASAEFGFSAALDNAGDTAAIGALDESSSATGVNDTAPGQSDTSAPSSGATYVYR